METVEEMIQQKISSITDLPEGYAPNLESKWELLEAGLNKKERPRRTAFYIQLVSGVAAALLLIGGAGLYVIKSNKPVISKPAKMAVLPLKKGTIKKQAAGVPSDQPVYAKVKSIKRKPGSLHVEPAVLISGEIAAVADSGLIIQPVEALASAPQKNARFVEVDFNNPAITDKAPSPAVVASKRFKFRIGTGTESNAGVQSGISFFRLRRSFN